MQNKFVRTKLRDTPTWQSATAMLMASMLVAWSLAMMPTCVACHTVRSRTAVHLKNASAPGNGSTLTPIMAE